MKKWPKLSLLDKNEQVHHDFMKVISPLRRVLPNSVTMNLWRYLCCLYLRIKKFSEQLKWRFLEKKTQKMIKNDDQMRKKKVIYIRFLCKIRDLSFVDGCPPPHQSFLQSNSLKTKSQSSFIKKEPFFGIFSI